MAVKKRLIDVNDALEKLCEYCSCGCYEECDCRCSEFDNISNIPTVDAVEVVHGKWGVYRENEISKTIYCTNCWKEFYIRKKGELQLDMMPYCPNCGAKMDGDGNA